MIILVSVHLHAATIRSGRIWFFRCVEVVMFGADHHVRDTEEGDILKISLVEPQLLSSSCIFCLLVCVFLFAKKSMKERRERERGGGGGGGETTV